MEHQALVSVICPVYNTSKYLNKCFNSVLNQQYKNIELILIDNASTDVSPNICDDFALQDERVKVTHLKENVGIAGARNKGLEKAKGKYIVFIDSDDFWVGNNGLGQLVSTIENNPHFDFLIFNVLFYNQIDDEFIKDHSFKRIESKEYNNKIDKIKDFSAITPMSVGAWSRIVKKDYLEKHHIRFKSIVLEDVEWNMNLFENCNDFGVIDLYFYAYRKQNPEATSTKFNADRFLGLFDTVKNMINDNADKKSKLSEVWLAYMALQLFVLIVGLYNLNNPQRDKMIKDIKKNLWVLKYGNTSNIIISRFLCSVFGLKTCAYFFHKYKMR